MPEATRTVWKKNERRALKVLRHAGLDHEQISIDAERVRKALAESKQFSGPQADALAQFFNGRSVSSLKDASSVYGCNPDVPVWTEDEDRALQAVHQKGLKPKKIRSDPAGVAQILVKAGFEEEIATGLSRQLAARTSGALSTRAYRIGCTEARLPLRHTARTDAAMSVLFHAGFSDPQILNGYSNIVDALVANDFGEYEAMEIASLFRGRSTKYLGDFRKEIGLVNEPTSWEPERIQALDAVRKQGLRGNDIVGQRDAAFKALRAAGYDEESAAIQASFLSGLTRSALNAAAVTYKLTQGPHVVWTTPRKNALKALHSAKFGIGKIEGHPAETEAALVAANFGRRQARELASFLAGKTSASLAGMIVELGIGDKQASDRAKKAKAERKMTPAQRDEWLAFVEERHMDKLQREIVDEWNTHRAGKDGCPQVTISMTSKAIRRIMNAELAK
ncbi:MAG: hypothetical protein U0136_07905 [Bdellovibrionota bacterium]